MARSTLYENRSCVVRLLGNVLSSAESLDRELTAHATLTVFVSSLALSSPSIVLFSMYAGLSSMTEDVECAMKQEQQRIQNSAVARTRRVLALSYSQSTSAVSAQ